VEHRDLDVGADQFGEFGEHCILFARKGADVDERLGGVRDDIVLVAGGGKRGGIGRGAKRGLDEPAFVVPVASAISSGPTFCGSASRMRASSPTVPWWCR
jgi:hypothetical protein